MPLPELIEIVPLDKPVRAEITVPGSKSITNRALILAALADGEVTLKGALWSEDTQIMVACLKELGFVVHIAPDPADSCNRTIMVMGQGGMVPPGGTETEPMELFVGNAGTAARFLAAFLCLGSGVYRLHGVPRMHERPQAALFQALRELGYRVECENDNDKLPVRIFAGNAGQMAESMTEFIQRKQVPPVPPQCHVSIAESSQFASALFLSSEVGGWEIEIEGENADESPYVVMTQKLMAVFPKKGGTFQIEPDASSGSYFWGADWVLWVSGFTTSLGMVSVNNWPVSGWQIDAKYRDIRDRDIRDPQLAIISRKAQLADSIMTDIVVSPLNYLKGSGGGVSSSFIFPDSPRRSPQPIPIRFTDLGRLRVQECDRVSAIVAELKKCGANIDEKNDTITVIADRALNLPPGDFIETYNDHRMAMCFAILGLKVPGIRIKNPACVKKTFPNFFQKIAAPPPNGLGAEIWEIKNGQRTRKLEGADLFAD